VLWKPRDIVSGDFYWLAPRNNQLFVAAADCTGHGVPGAFMSIMGISFLNQIVGSPEAKNAADTLNMLRHNVITALNKEQSGATSNKDGMDIALCVFDLGKKQVEYAGAYNSLYIFRDGELLETKADRMPIGVHDRDSIPFKNNIVDLKSGDQLYMFSDGYIDQFGGPKGKKFMTKRFKKFLLEITNLTMTEQKERLWENIVEWRGEIEQVDDIIIIGIRIE
jgi:serine phosphatase RsbU (regulator of sigma subunit)